MGIPRTIIPTSGAVSFGDINAAIEWSFSRSNSFMRGNGGFQDGSLVASWNADLITYPYIDGDDGYTSFTLRGYEESYDTLPDLQVDVDVDVDIDVYYYDASLTTVTSIDKYIGVVWPNLYFVAGTSIAANTYSYLDFPAWGGYGGSGSYSFPGSIVSISPTQSGTAVDQSAGYGVEEFRGKSRYRGYSASLSCIQC
jgi:hypothetical protein